MSFAIADAHNDLLIELDHRRQEPSPFARHWLGPLELGGVVLQVCPVFTAEPDWLPELSLRRALGQVRAFDRALAENPDRLVRILSASDLGLLEGSDRIGLMLSMEGVEALGYDPTLIDVFWRLGVRMVSLTWNRRNPFADGVAEPSDGGLSRLGRELVDRLLGLGIVIDLAHASERTFADVLERAERGTVLVSHAACRAVCDTPRNLSDDQLRALADRGGVLAMMLLPLVIDPVRPEVGRAVAHFDHAVEVMGVEHVGLGGDFIRQVQRAVGMREPSDALIPAGLSWEAAIDGLEGPEGYPMLLDALATSGYGDGDLQAICGGNLRRLLGKGLPGGGA